MWAPLFILASVTAAQTANIDVNIAKLRKLEVSLESRGLFNFTIEVGHSTQSLKNPSELIPLKRKLDRFNFTIEAGPGPHVTFNTDGLKDPSLLIPLKRSLEPSSRTDTTQCGCGYSIANPSPVSGRIVAGNEVVAHTLPYQVYLQSCSNAGCAMCGATLLNRRYVMTAMHCVEDTTADRLTVVLGEHNIQQDIENHAAKSIQVERIIKRADYDPNEINNDVALLRLAEDVLFNVNTVPACLPSSTGQMYDNWSAKVSGWGTTSESGSTSAVLKETDQTILPQTDSKCVQGAGGEGSTTPVPITKLCGYKAGTDSCQGDSGGPLVVMENGRWTVVGVVSYGFGCARLGFAGIYARVTNYLDWINENINDGWCDTVSAPVVSTAGPWCDFRCTNVGSLTQSDITLNGISCDCADGFCAAKDGSSLCNTFNYPCGTAQPGTSATTTTSATTASTASTASTTTPTTTTPTTTQAPVLCPKPCNLSQALAELKKIYPTGLYNIVVGPFWNRIPGIANMNTGMVCPTDYPESDLCVRLGLASSYTK